jgi:flagellar biosynthesis protein FlhG
MIDQAARLRTLIEEKRTLRRSPSASTTAKRHCMTVAVTSGKGGVGKSNLSLMLAIALGIEKKRVLLLDADLGLANIHILLGTAPRISIADALSTGTDFGSAVVTGPADISILPGASGLESLANIEPLRLEMLKRMLATVEERYEYLIIDTGAGIGRTVTSFCVSADRTILVLTPEPTSLADAYAMVKVLYDKGATAISVLVNMAASDAEAREVFDKLNTLVVRFLQRPLDLLGIVPSDPQIPRLVRRQRILLLDEPGRTAAKRIVAAAHALAGTPVPAKVEGFFSRFFGDRQHSTR